ncbi:YlmH/Sll1252 family protein [Lachnospiraceae bacterium ZAX-1]
MEMTKDELLLSRRFVDLSMQAQHKGLVTFSNFLNLNELNIFQRTISKLYGDYEMSGGIEFLERQMIAFLPDALNYGIENPKEPLLDFPIACLKIRPKSNAFSDVLTHQDVLGSIMHLGLERNKIGDILLDDSIVYLFCQKNISQFILDELTKIKRTAIYSELIIPKDLNIKPNFELTEGIISSNRLDSVTACICHISRTEAVTCIKNGKVFIQNREMKSCSYECKETDIISVRTHGRFRYLGCIGETRKGRIKIQYEIYK